MKAKVNATLFLGALAAPLVALTMAATSGGSLLDSRLVAAHASKPSGGGGGHHSSSTTYSGSFSLVLLNSTDGSAHWGQQVTFNVTSNAPYYFVELDCSQSGTVVYQQVNGFYPGWPWSKTYTLQSAAWTGGAASCNAQLYSANSDGTNRQTLANLSVPVSA